MTDPPITSRELLDRLAALGYRTQAEQAAALGIERSAISHLARGTSKQPAASTVRVLALLEELHGQGARAGGDPGGL